MRCGTDKLNDMQFWQRGADAFSVQAGTVVELP